MITVYDQTEAGYRPGTIGRCTELMSRFYSAAFGLGFKFERYTAGALSHFFENFDSRTDAFWSAERDGQIVGCAGVDGQAGSGTRAQFRWFFLDESVRGAGLGRQLMERAIRFAAAAEMDKLVLTTHERLAAAVSVYTANGFERSGFTTSSDWGVPLVLSHFELDLHKVRRVQPTVDSLPATPACT